MSSPQCTIYVSFAEDLLGLNLAANGYQIWLAIENLMNIGFELREDSRNLNDEKDDGKGEGGIDVLGLKSGFEVSVEEEHPTTRAEKTLIFRVFSTPTRRRAVPNR